MKSCSRSIHNCAHVKTPLTRLFATVLAIAFLTAGASASSSPTICNNQVLPAGNGGDLIVTTGTCTVDGTAPSGTYLYKNVNIILGGTLLFKDAAINFWAKSILVENTGSLLAGTRAAPIGTAGGQLTIHLWGMDEGTGSGTSGGQGIVCKTPVTNTSSACGIPSTIWNSNTMSMLDPTSCVQNSLPGGVTDCFYQYMPLDYDGGGPPVGYFGYKVLAVSYGGTLELYGKKGATYHSVKPSSSSTSWARLNSSVSTGGNSLVLDRTVDWQAGDQIVLSTTDYLPGHSEQLTIASVSTSNGVTTITTTAAVAYPHNGTTYDLKAAPSGTGPDQDPNVTCSAGQTRCVETRAAVGLLTRSIQIVSGGDTLQAPFNGYSNCMSGNPPTCSSSNEDCYFFGGHTIVRQGFNKFQVQGVEFYQLGQGGRIMHYPVHFHMARQTPVNTFVTDSSVWDSMTRWYTIHATQGVTLARNVGYLSIGHGYYFEDGTETDNRLSANLGVFARGAIINDQNPRCVPGILAEPYQEYGVDQVPYSTDIDHPTSYWITNGWNDFQYNMAAGTGTCGMCYWLTPAGNSGASRSEYWTGYSAEQQVTQSNGGYDPTRSGTTPLKSFVGNSCVSSQSAFITIAQTVACLGVVNNADTGAPQVQPVPNPLAPTPSSPNYGSYYPLVDAAGSRMATQCPPGLDCSCSTTSGCPSGKQGVPVCGAADLQYCMVTLLDHFTTSFNWAQTNFAAMWLRPQWYLVSNSAITDVQNGGLTMVSGGGYTNSDQVPGYWALAHKNVFIGNTQSGNPYASNAGPFNPSTLKLDPTLSCALRTDGTNAPEAAFCLNADQGISMPLDNFAVNQRLFNIYDGPSFQDSNAYLDITPTTLAGCELPPNGGGGAACQSMGWMYGNVNGVPLDPIATLGSQAYLPNAGIGWKQPNGFFYPPAFHSKNLFFNNVPIQHFVIEPLFNTGTYDTNGSLIPTRYFNDAGGLNGPAGMFNGFTDIDRQTELSDDDGSLTGLLGAPIPGTQLHRPAISVNKDTFFSAPVQTVECASDILDNMPQPWSTCNLPEPLCGTANTSPYDYVTTVVYPTTTDGNMTCNPQPNWGVTCTQPNCFGVPLYRLDLVPSDNNVAPFIRMASQADCQRSSLTVNHGTYYMDTGSSLATQNAWNEFGPPSVNVFTENNTYYTFLLFAKPTTAQTYQLYVGTNFNPADTSQLWVARINKGPSPFVFYQDPNDVMVACSSRKPGADFAWCYDYDSSSGILSVTMDMSFSKFAQEYGQAIEHQCQPANYCTWNVSSKSCGCSLTVGDPRYTECQNACSNWATKAIDCPWDASDFSTGPTGACYGFGFALQQGFMAADQPAPAGTCLTSSPTWNVPLTAASPTTAGSCAYTANMLPTGSFCASGKKR